MQKPTATPYNKQVTPPTPNTVPKFNEFQVPVPCSKHYNSCKPLSLGVNNHGRSITNWYFRTKSQPSRADRNRPRSEEHTSELQSRPHLVCRLLLEKKNTKIA